MWKHDDGTRSNWLVMNAGLPSNVLDSTSTNSNLEDGLIVGPLTIMSYRAINKCFDPLAVGLSRNPLAMVAPPVSPRTSSDATVPPSQPTPFVAPDIQCEGKAKQSSIHTGLRTYPPSAN